jgi:hypothetical protein
VSDRFCVLLLGPSSTSSLRRGGPGRVCWGRSSARGSPALISVLRSGVAPSGDMMVDGLSVTRCGEGGHRARTDGRAGGTTRRQPFVRWFPMTSRATRQRARPRRRHPGELKSESNRPDTARRDRDGNQLVAAGRRGTVEFPPRSWSLRYSFGVSEIHGRRSRRCWVTRPAISPRAAHTSARAHSVPLGDRFAQAAAVQPHLRLPRPGESDSRCPAAPTRPARRHSRTARPGTLANRARMR